MLLFFVSLILCVEGKDRQTPDCVEQELKKKIKVGLLIDEFFGGANTVFAGFGFLARRFIAKYIPDENIGIEVILGRSHNPKNKMVAEEFHEDDVTLYKLPTDNDYARQFLEKKAYDIYLSIEITIRHIFKNEPDPNKKLIFWIQDPRPKSEWDNVINTMQCIKEKYYFRQSLYDAVNKWANEKRIKFVSQGYSLNPLAIELYNLSKDTPIQYLPNPLDIDFEYQFDLSAKKKQVLFLGRLAAPKRAWLFCEVAKKMPEYEFNVVGEIDPRDFEKNQRILKPYMKGNIPNLHFLGQLDGKEKIRLIKESRILLSTSIHEGIAISWLEALSYGTLIVSNLEREKLVERFGGKAPDLLGDGFDGVDSFIPVIRDLMENDEVFTRKAEAAIEYIRETHNIDRFVKDLRKIILDEVAEKKDSELNEL